MKIRRLRLTNFACFKEADVEFDRPISLILGDNAVGKTSLVTAIELLLLGKTARFSGHRIGNLALIGSGSSTADVEGALSVSESKSVTIRRHIATAGLETSVNDHRVSKEIYDFYSPPQMRNAERAWRAVLTVGGVLDRDEADQRLVLLDLVDPALPPGALDGLRWDLVEGGAPTTLDGLEKAHDAVYKARTGAKRRLSEAVVHEPDRPKPSLEAIQRKLDELDRRRVAVEAQLGEGRGHRQALEGERARGIEARDRLAIELQELGSEADAKKAITAAEQALKGAHEAQDARQKVEVQVTATEGRLKTIAALEGALARQGAKCETCGQKLTAEKRQERGEALKVERGNLEGWLKKHAQGGLRGDGVAGPLRALEDAKRRLTMIGDRMLRHAAVGHRLKALDTELARTPAADPTLEAELAELRDRLQRGQQILGEARVLCHRLDRAEEQRDQRRKLEDEVAALERLCEVLGPKGLGQTLLTERIGDVLQKLNRVLARFGLTMAVQQSPWGLWFNGRPALLLSASERFRAGVAFQVAVGALTGAKLAVIDGADLLDTGNLQILLDLLKDAVGKGLIDQAIATATTRHPDWIAAKWLAPVRAYHLPEPGRIERLP